MLSRNLTFFVITLAMTVFHKNAIAQLYRINSDSAVDNSEWRIGLRYTSDYYFMGRADSAQAPYLSPSVGYYHHSGFFVRSSLSYLTAAGENRIDLYTLSGGFDHYGAKTVVGLAFYEYFYNDLSYAIPSEMSTLLNAYAGYDFSIVAFFADFSLAFSDGTDLFIQSEINRTFYALRNRLRITPAFYINAGSQKYYNEYYSNRSGQTGSGYGSGNGKGHGGGGQPGQYTQYLQVEEAEKFKLLDYEFDLQLTYRIGKLRIYSSGTWAFPVNPATVLTDNGPYEEELSNGFYWTAGLRLTL